jgi:hypothetical protein
VRRSTKYQNEIPFDFSNFQGGVNYTEPSFCIADNELSKGINVELNTEGRLQTRPRLGTAVVTLPSKIKKTWKHPESGVVLAVAGTKLYAVDYSSYTEIGELTGVNVPEFCYWDSKVYVASGGKLQKLVGMYLITLANSPDCDIVYSRFGRLCVSKEGQDYILYSSVGDSDSEEAWKEDSNNLAQAQELEVAYKESGSIMTIVPLLSELAVFRTAGIYRVISEAPDWNVLEVTKEYTALNRNCAVQLANTVVFLSSSGLKELSGVQEYGDIRQHEFAQKVNQWLSDNVDPKEAWVKHLKSRKQLIIKPNSLPIVLVYHYLYDAVTFWRFDETISDIVEVGTNLVAAQDNSLYWLSREHPYDNDNPVIAEAVTKEYRKSNDYLVKKVAVMVRNTHPGSLDLSVSGVPITIALTCDQLIYNDDELIYNDDSLIWDDNQVDEEERNVVRANKLQLSITSSTDFILDQIQIETAVIGHG